MVDDVNLLTFEDCVQIINDSDLDYNLPPIEYIEFFDLLTTGDKLNKYLEDHSQKEVFKMLLQAFISKYENDQLHQSPDDFFKELNQEFPTQGSLQLYIKILERYAIAKFCPSEPRVIFDRNLLLHKIATSTLKASGNDKNKQINKAKKRLAQIDKLITDGEARTKEEARYKLKISESTYKRDRKLLKEIRLMYVVPLKNYI